MSKLVINGVELTGEHLMVSGRKIVIDGIDVTAKLGDNLKALDIKIIEGSLQSLTCDGNVTAGAVKGSVSAGGNVKSDCVGGSVSAGGNVNCGRIQGSVSAGGNVRHA